MSAPFLLPPPRIEPTPRRIRVRADGALLAESDDAMLVVWYGPGRLPTYFIPPGDVHTELLRPSSAKGEGFLENHDVAVDDRLIPGAAKVVRDPPGDFAEIDGYWTFTWERGIEWYEEAMEVHVHARDPEKRVDVVPSDRHVRVEIDGVTIAESSRTHALFETRLPTRWYFPRDDVRLDLLHPTDLVTRCPYKGAASYWSAQVGEHPDRHRDVAWSYAEPIPECPRIAGLIAFFNERVDLYLDGELQQRPSSPWTQTPR